ncbi:DsrE family protein [Ectothiorhodospiraceae bacterium 2226]|nr:DsrE family protein [Ectothiorhodospiraceae bacterium 2226]
MSSIAKKLAAIATAGFLALGLAACAAPQAQDRGAAANGYQKQKAVYHINDAENAFAGLRNIQNHLNAVGDENADIVVVTHGRGIDFLLSDWADSQGRSLGDPVHELASRGVEFKICNNTLVGRQIDANRINLNAEVVPSGVASVSEYQHLGYTYVKP